MLLDIVEIEREKEREERENEIDRPNITENKYIHTPHVRSSVCDCLWVINFESISESEWMCIIFNISFENIVWTRPLTLNFWIDVVMLLMLFNFIRLQFFFVPFHHQLFITSDVIYNKQKFCQIWFGFFFNMKSIYF